jgi:hypothetical protein
LAEVNPFDESVGKDWLKNIESLTDPDDGEIWHWRLERNK